MDQPLVSVICLCYDHSRFVREAVESVINQTYKSLQIIIVDDASRDESATEIKRLSEEYPLLEVLLLPNNAGNCKAFNAAYKLVKGDFVIDFATDDVMMPDRIEKQVQFFESLAPSVGVIFTDAVYIDINNKAIRNHYEHLFSKKLLTRIPEGDVYQDVLRRYFISSPTMLIRKKVLDDLNGYDENLSYEDFDFWVRSSRDYQYAFLNERLTKVRRKYASLSSGFYRPGNPHLRSTYLVCKKAQQLNRSTGDKEALITRVRYELRQSVFTENYHEATLFFRLLGDLQPPQWVDRFIFELAKYKLPLRYVRTLYQRFRYG